MTTDPHYLEALKREYTSGIWWITFLQTWATLAEVLEHEQEIARQREAIAAIRAKFMRPGRPTGWRKRKKTDDGQSD